MTKRLVSGKRVALKDEDRWLSVEEIAPYLGVKRDTIYKWLTRRKMPAHKVGKLWKFRKEDVDRWIRSGKARHK